MTLKDQLTLLMHDMEDFSPYKRVEAIKKIGKLDIPISDLPLDLHSMLEKALFDPAPEVRSEAVMTIAFLEGEITAPLLEPLLSDSDANVRSNVISALSYTKIAASDKLAKSLIECMKDTNVHIRDRCARALGRLKINAAETVLIKTVFEDISPIVRTGAVVGLGMLENASLELISQLRSHLITEESDLVKHEIEETIARLTPPNG
jgi:vesicle coat complex subunit